MIVDLPDTTTSKVSKKIMSMREQGGVVALGRVLTLVVITKGGLEEEAIEAANLASREHPCRIIVLARSLEGRRPTRLDAQIRVGGDAGASEVIVLRGYGELATESESLVSALLLPDAPIVAWWPHGAPENACADLDRTHRAPPDHRLGQRTGPAGSAGAHPRHLRRRGHGPGLDAADQLADPAGSRAGPGGSGTGHGADGGGGQRLPEHPAAGRLAAPWPCARRSPSRRIRRAPASAGCVMERASGNVELVRPGTVEAN